ncbi:hypothetical protein D3Z51_09640 [Clostridiaceae bacterium]|nr:hypothetical protein [Clostridiaceae bacterium]RKI14111.1 hypothetical protein D7V81_09125 [bacterium 1XD21-70]
MYSIAQLKMEGKGWGGILYYLMLYWGDSPIRHGEKGGYAGGHGACGRFLDETEKCKNIQRKRR